MCLEWPGLDLRQGCNEYTGYGIFHGTIPLNVNGLSIIWGHSQCLDGYFCQSGALFRNDENRW